MSYLARRKLTGPLNPTQTQVLKLAAEGLSHGQIAMRLNISRQYVSENLGVTFRKMGAGSTAHAIAIYSRYMAYHAAADQVARVLIADPLGEVEEHVNHVLEGLALVLRVTGDRLLPR